MGDRYFGIYTNFALSACSQSENNQYLKKNQLIGKDSAYLFFIYRQCLCSKPNDNAIMVETNH